MVAKGNAVCCASFSLGYSDVRDVEAEVQDGCGVALAGPSKRFEQFGEGRFQIKLQVCSGRKHDRPGIHHDFFSSHAESHSP